MCDKLNDLKAKREDAKKAVREAKKEEKNALRKRARLLKASHAPCTFSMLDAWMHDEWIHGYKDTWMHGCVDAKMHSLCFQAAKGLSSEDLKLVIQAKDKVEADRQAGFYPPCAPLYFLVVCDVATSEAEAAQCG